MIRKIIRILLIAAATVVVAFLVMAGVVAYYVINGPFTAADEAGGRALPKSMPMALVSVNRSQDDYLIDGVRFKVPRGIQRGSSRSENAMLIELPLPRELTGETRPESELHIMEKTMLIYFGSADAIIPSRVEEVERLLNVHGHQSPSCLDQPDGKILEAIEVKRPPYDNDTHYVACDSGRSHVYIRCDKKAKGVYHACKIKGFYRGKSAFQLSISHIYLERAHKIHEHVFETLRGFEVVDDSAGQLTPDAAGGRDGRP